MIKIILHLVVVAIIVAGMFRGWKKGMLAQVSDLLAIIFGIVCARIWYDAGYSVAERVVDTVAGKYYAAYVWSSVSTGSIFLLVFLLIRTVTSILNRFVTHVSDGVFNKLIGALFSLFKYTLVMSVVLNFYMAYRHNSDLMKNAAHGDGNLIGGIMLLSPALLGGESIDDLYHYYRLEDAKKFNK